MIGASAGGIPALESVVREFRPDIDASIFVVLHVAADTRTALDRVVAFYTRLPVSIARDSEHIDAAHIYVAAPDHHLMLEHDCVRSVRGPRELVQAIS